MIQDNLLLFTGTSNGATATIASSAYADLPTTGTQRSSNIVDLGLIGGIPASAVGGGGARDIGIGDKPALKFVARNLTAWSATATVQLLLEGAPDAGANTPGSYTQMWASAVIPAATLAVAGIDLANVDMPRLAPLQPLPRYLRLSFVVAVTTNTVGTVQAEIVIDQDNPIISATGYPSGYQAGVTVAN